jgi:hypothetical protein
VVEHLHAEGQQVGDPLPLGVSHGPQFEVLDAIVEPVPISMMHDFVRQKRSAEVYRHHQSVLTHLGSPSHQVSKWLGDCNLSVAMAEMPEAGTLSNRTILLGISGIQVTLVMGGAEAFRLVEPIAIIERTESLANPQRLLGRRSGPQQPQVMAMAVTLRLGLPVAIGRFASGV